ncbi:MAG: thymidine phosphorylase family protein [Henriciella sp.]
MTRSRLNTLKARRLGIAGSHEAVAYIRKDCDVCLSEGFGPHTRVQLSHGANNATATLRHVSEDWLGLGEIGLNEVAWERLSLVNSEPIEIRHMPVLTSFRGVRRRMFGGEYSKQDVRDIVADIAANRYSDLQLTAFVATGAARPLSIDETIALTQAMIETGTRMRWDDDEVYDKHCVGGLPGNRTTPIIVSIIAAHGMKIPKTSSRAITSPAGTADTMETITRVNLSPSEMREVVETCNGCMVWGSALDFSPVDEAVIRVEKALDFDSPASMVASVLSKKVGAGATKVLIDIPVGPTAKVRNQAEARAISDVFTAVAEAVGLTLRIEITDGSQPIGYGIGPALEARDVLAVLGNEEAAPPALTDKACLLAGALLEMGGRAKAGAGAKLARETIESGAARQRFEMICRAQGAFRTPPLATHLRSVEASQTGRVQAVDNRRLSRAAKLTGAPEDAAAGLDLHVRVGDRVERGTKLFTLHTTSLGELAYALDYVHANPDIVQVAQ